MQDAEDLSFKKNDILVVVERNEEKWWTAMDDKGNKGLIPEPYVKRVGIACEIHASCSYVINAVLEMIVAHHTLSDQILKMSGQFDFMIGHDDQSCHQHILIYLLEGVVTSINVVQSNLSNLQPKGRFKRIKIVSCE